VSADTVKWRLVSRRTLEERYDNFILLITTWLFLSFLASSALVKNFSLCQGYHICGVFWSIVFLEFFAFACRTTSVIAKYKYKLNKISKKDGNLNYDSVFRVTGIIYYFCHVLLFQTVRTLLVMGTLTGMAGLVALLTSFRSRISWKESLTRRKDNFFRSEMARLLSKINS